MRYNFTGSLWIPWILALVSMTLGCAEYLHPIGKKEAALAPSFAPGTIFAAKTEAAVDFDAMMADLKSVRVIYIGESHTRGSDHQIQLKLLQALLKEHPNLAVGMEMFAGTYQAVLDRWSRGELETDAFLQQTHWYTNWRYPFDLYREILEFVKSNRIPLFGLNIPFHIPPKISIGGIDSLSEQEKGLLPRRIDLTRADHRAYVEGIFNHHRIPGRDDFENFYAAQCVWEDIMAESIARNLDGHVMVVLAGKGHIARKYGIPDRAYDRTGAPFRTIIPRAPDSGEIDFAIADYIWITD